MFAGSCNCLLAVTIFSIVSARLLSLFANDIVCCCNNRKASSCNCLLAVTIFSIVSVWLLSLFANDIVSCCNTRKATHAHILK